MKIPRVLGRTKEPLDQSGGGWKLPPSSPSNPPMASPTMSSRVSRDTVVRAVEALVKWMRTQAKQRKAQLLEHDDLLYLVLTLKRIPPTSRINPFRIPLPHPIHPLSSASVCLLLDDRPHSSLTPAAARDRVEAESLPISQLIALSDLRSDYRPYEARRRLCDSYDLFFADRRILPLLPRLLGKHFFKKKKTPLAVDLSRPGWPEQIRHSCDSTLLYLRTGTCSGLKVGRVSQDLEQIVDNVMTALDGAMEHVPRKWANIRSLHIKSVDSLALPIYQAVPELGLKIPGKKVSYNEEEPLEGEVIQMEEREGEKKPLEGTSKMNKRKSGRLPQKVTNIVEGGEDKEMDELEAAVKSFINDNENAIDDKDNAIGGEEKTEMNKKNKKKKVDVEKRGKKPLEGSLKKNTKKKEQLQEVTNNVVGDDDDDGVDKEFAELEAAVKSFIDDNENLVDEDGDMEEKTVVNKIKKRKVDAEKRVKKDITVKTGKISRKEKTEEKSVKKVKRCKVKHCC